MDRLRFVGFPDGSVVKNPPTNAGNTGDMGLIPGSGRFPQRRKWQPTPVFLPGESHGHTSLVGCSLWVTKSRTWVSRHAQRKETEVEGGKVGCLRSSCNQGRCSGPLARAMRQHEERKEYSSPLCVLGRAGGGGAGITVGPLSQQDVLFFGTHTPPPRFCLRSC